jgi:hypothetical protein
MLDWKVKGDKSGGAGIKKEKRRREDNGNCMCEENSNVELNAALLNRDAPATGALLGKAWGRILGLGTSGSPQVVGLSVASQFLLHISIMEFETWCMVFVAIYRTKVQDL